MKKEPTKQELDKFLHENLHEDIIKALDARYIKVDNEKANSIVSKKQKIADFYNSLDDEEKILLAMVSFRSQDIAIEEQTLKICSPLSNPCEDYQELISKKYKYLASKMFSKDGPVVTSKMSIFGL